MAEYMEIDPTVPPPPLYGSTIRRYDSTVVLYFPVTHDHTFHCTEPGCTRSWSFPGNWRRSFNNYYIHVINDHGIHIMVKDRRCFQCNRIINNKRPSSHRCHIRSPLPRVQIMPEPPPATRPFLTPTFDSVTVTLPDSHLWICSFEKCPFRVVHTSWYFRFSTYKKHMREEHGIPITRQMLRKTCILCLQVLQSSRFRLHWDKCPNQDAAMALL